MPSVAPSLAKDPELSGHATPDAEVVDIDKTCDEHTSPVKEGLHFKNDNIEPVNAKPSVAKTDVVPDPKDPNEAKVDADVELMESVAQAGVEAVERMVETEDGSDSPIFLSDLVKNSKKRKATKDGKRVKLKGDKDVK